MIKTVMSTILQRKIGYLLGVIEYFFKEILSLRRSCSKTSMKWMTLKLPSPKSTIEFPITSLIIDP
jgi:hypothetical protein